MVKCKKCGREVEIIHEGLCLSCYMTRKPGNPCEFDPERYWEDQLRNLGFRSAVESDSKRVGKNYVTEKIDINKDLYVLYFIYQNYGTEFCAFSELVEKLKERLTKGEIVSACSTLEDWSCLESTYGPIGRDKVGSGWTVDTKYGTESRLKSNPVDLDKVTILERKERIK